MDKTPDTVTGEPFTVEVTAENIAENRKDRYCAAELALVAHFGKHVEASYEHVTVYTNIEPMIAGRYPEGQDWSTHTRYAMDQASGDGIHAVDLNSGRTDAERQVVPPFTLTLTPIATIDDEPTPTP